MMRTSYPANNSQDNYSTHNNSTRKNSENSHGSIGSPTLSALQHLYPKSPSWAEYVSLRLTSSSGTIPTRSHTPCSTGLESTGPHSRPCILDREETATTPA